MQGGDRRDPGEAADKSGKQLGVADLSCEAELEGHIRNSILIVVDKHLIDHVVIEGEIVRPVGRLKKRVNVQNEGDVVRIIVADKGVPVGDIRGTVQGRDGRFAMARRERAGRDQHE